MRFPSLLLLCCLYLILRIDIATAVDYPDTHPDYVTLYNYVNANIERSNRQRLANQMDDLYFVLRYDRNHRDFDSGMYQALKEINRLINSQIIRAFCDVDECNNMIKPIAGKTRVHRYYVNPIRDLSPMEELLHFKMLKHAQICMPKYIQTFKRIDSIGQEGNQIKNIAMSLIGNYANEGSYLSLEEHAKALVMHEPRDHLEEMAIAAAVQLRFGLKPEEGSFTDEQLYDRYIREPCDHYVNLMGREVFELVLFEAQMFENIQSAFDLFVDSTTDFYVGLASYKICKTINYNDDFKRLVLSFID